jgi:uncharacterized repeat protein (TIGR03803 family)
MRGNFVKVGKETHESVRKRTMTNQRQPEGWLSGATLGVASAALALAVMLVSAAITTQVAQAQTLTTLHSFDGTDGVRPTARLVQANNGNLYGVTSEGGADGYGTIFKITPTGALTTLHSFDKTDGESPVAGLIQATDGNLYGTTEVGGAYGLGTVFKITPSGTLTTLHSFGSPNDGAYAAAD